MEPMLVRLALFLIWLPVPIGILLYTLWFVRDSNRSGEPERFYGIVDRWLRRYIVLGLVVGLLVVGLGVAIPNYPYPQIRGLEARYHVSVVGMQFTWIINTTRVPANVPVEFIVTSRDVNHGLGIYDERGVMIAQVQAMPGYVNRLVVTLPPGRYYLVCIEYCGIAHHKMRAVITAGEVGA